MFQEKNGRREEERSKQSCRQKITPASPVSPVFDLGYECSVRVNVAQRSAFDINETAY
jgi:hypothetical protein